MNLKEPNDMVATAARNGEDIGPEGPAVLSSVDRVHDTLRERILSGDYPPGSRLVLARLSEEHGVSFIPIREALQRLEAERLICHRNQPGRLGGRDLDRRHARHLRNAGGSRATRYS